MTTGAVRLGLIGCGAATQICHLPASARTRDVTVVALVDKNVDRARSLARRYRVPRYAADYREIGAEVDGVIVALPNVLHVPVAAEFLTQGVPVLVEKPLASSVEEADTLIRLARAKRLPLQVGHRFRFSKAVQLTKRVIEEGWLGTLEGFSLEFGEIYSWPVASGFFSSKGQAEGGVLIDTGSHMLDLLLGWLGPVVDVEYSDDSLGGVESECQLRLMLRTPSGDVQGDVTLSRLRSLRCSVLFRGDRFSLECDLSGRYEVRIRPRGWSESDPTFVSSFAPLPPDSFGRMFVEQLRAFARAIRTGTEAAVSGESVLPTVALIERCYRERKRLSYAWEGGERAREQIA